jgi:WD40 repeat protein
MAIDLRETRSHGIRAVIIFIGLAIVFIAGCSSTIQQTPTPSPKTETPTSTPSPTTTPTPLSLKISKITELGRGVMSPIYRSPDVKTIVVGEGQILRWFDAETFEELGSLGMGDLYLGIWGVVFSPDSKLVAVEGLVVAQVVDLANHTIVATLGGGGLGPIGGLCFSKDNRYIAFLVGYRTSGGPHHYISLWDVLNDKDLGYDPYDVDSYHFSTLMSGRYNTMSGPAISPDGELVAAGHSDGRVYVWDRETGEIRFLLEGHASEVTNVDFSPDGRYLASGSRDGTVRLWNASTGRLYRVITGLLDDIRYVQFSPDGRILEIGVRDLPAQSYDLSTRQLQALDEPIPTPDPFGMELTHLGFSEGSSCFNGQVLFGPDGRTLAMASRNVLLWDLTTHKLRNVLVNPGEGDIRGVAFSPDGGKLAAITLQDEVIVWDTYTGKLILTQKSSFLSGTTVFYASGDSITGPARGAGAISEQGLAFSSDGERLAFGNRNTIEIWDVARASQVSSLEFNKMTSFPTKLSFSEDGERLFVVLNRNSSVQVWDPQTGKLLREVDLPVVDPNAFSAIALNGPHFARNNSDDQGSWIELWDLEDEEYIKLVTPSRETEPLRFSPDGSLLVAISGGRLYFWKTETGQLIYESEEEFGLSGLAISLDNKTLAVSREGKAQLWDIESIHAASLLPELPQVNPRPTSTPWTSDWPTDTPYPTVSATIIPPPSLPATAISPANADLVAELARFGKGTIDQVAWSAEGQTIITVGSQGVFRYDPTTLIEISHLEIGDWAYSAVLLSDGRWLAAGVRDGKVRVWDADSGEILTTLEGDGEPVLSPDGTRLVFLNEEANLQVWDIDGDRALSTPRSYSYYSRWPVFSPDGELVAAIQSTLSQVRYDDAVRVWDVRTGAVVNALDGPDNDLTDLSFSLDGRYIIGAAGGSAWIWDVRPGKDPEQIELYEGVIDGNLTLYEQTVTAAALSPDNRMLAVGTSENTIRLYNRYSQIVLRELNGHSDAIRHISFSPNGTALLSVDRDGGMMVWDVTSGRSLNSLHAHTGEIGGLVFQTDGELTAWENGTAWTIHPPDGELLGSIRLQSGTILAASPDGEWLAIYHPYTMSLLNAQTNVIWRTLEGEAVEPWVEYYYEGLIFRGFNGAAFSLDSSRLVTLGTGGAWIYDTEDGQLIQQFLGNDAREAYFSPDGRWLVASLNEFQRYLVTLDIESGRTLLEIETREAVASQIAFSPNRRWVGALAQPLNEPFQLLLWDANTAELTESVSFSEEIPLTSLAFSPDSQLAAIGQADGLIFFVDLTTFEIIANLRGHLGSVDHLAFSIDGSYLASGGIDGTVRIWGLRQE